MGEGRFWLAKSKQDEKSEEVGASVKVCQENRKGRGRDKKGGRERESAGGSDCPNPTFKRHSGHIPAH